MQWVDECDCEVSAHLLSVRSDDLKPNHPMGVDLKSFAAFEQRWAEMWCTQLRQQSKAFMTVFLLVCVCRGLTGWGRTLRWDVAVCRGKTGTTMKQSKGIHLDLVSPELLIDVLSNIDGSCTPYSACAHLCTRRSNCNRPIPSLGLIALQLCSNHVNLCYECSSSVIHTVYICYSNHQLGFTFCWGKSASIQTVHIIRKGFVPEMSR